MRLRPRQGAERRAGGLYSALNEFFSLMTAASCSIFRSWRLHLKS